MKVPDLNIIAVRDSKTRFSLYLHRLIQVLPTRFADRWEWLRGFWWNHFKFTSRDDVLDDLRARLRRTRWPDQIPGRGECFARQIIPRKA